MMAKDIGALTVTIDLAQDFAALRDACIAFFLGHGLTMVSYHHLPPPGATDYDPTITVAAHGFPQDWVDRYVSERYYDVDPIPKKALATTEPFLWSEVRRMPGLSRPELAYLDELANAELGDGLAVPVFGPYGRNGYAGLGYGKAGVSPTLVERKTLQWACQMGHQKYCDLLRTQSPQTVPLSQREHEILQWVAKGKSNSVIADIVGISTYTVDTYLRRIFVKLGVYDRVTAALRALAIGELT